MLSREPATLEEQQQHWLIQNLASVEQQLNDLYLPDLVPPQDPDDGTMLEQLEHVLKLGREHLSKLKFNFLELQTKRRFLEHVSDPHAWSSIPVVWAPGPLKTLEMQAQSAKDALKAVKDAQAGIKQAIEQTCEALAQRLSECIRKRGEAVGLIAKVRELLQEIDAKQANSPSSYHEAMSSWSIPELKHKLDGLKVEVEKKKAALSVQKQAVSDLDRLLSHQADQLDRQQAVKSGLEEDLRAIKTSPQSTGAVAELCRWYRSMTELTEEMTGVHCEVVRPDYLHVTVTNPQNAASVPIHLTIDPVSGKLLAVSIGSTAATPKMQWRELIDLAIKTNDIPLLVRQVHYRLIKS